MSTPRRRPTADHEAVDGASRSAALKRSLRAAVTERLGYKGAALFFALVLWLVVSAEEPAEELVPVRLSLTTDSSLVLLGERQQIRALVVGRGRDLIKLYDTPPVIRRAFGPETPEEVRIALRPIEVELPPGIEAVVRDVQPRSVVLRFGRRPVPPAAVDSTLPVDSGPPPTDPIGIDTLPTDSALVPAPRVGPEPGAAPR